MNVQNQDTPISLDCKVDAEENLYVTNLSMGLHPLTCSETPGKSPECRLNRPP